MINSINGFSQTPSTITVTGQSRLEIIPDQAFIEASIDEYSPSFQMDSALPANSVADSRQQLEKKMNDVLAKLLAIPINRSAIQADNFMIQPERIGNNDKPRLRLHLSRTLTIRLDDLTQIPDVIHILTQANIQSLHGIRYDVKSRQELQDKLLTEAVINAQNQAKMIANSLNRNLGEPLQISASRYSPYQPVMFAARTASNDNASYEPGKITLSAEVTASFAIGNQH